MEHSDAGTTELTASPQPPKYSLEISTSAKGFHSFTVKVHGDDLLQAMLDLYNATDYVGKLVNTLNEGVK